MNRSLLLTCLVILCTVSCKLQLKAQVNPPPKIWDKLIGGENSDDVSVLLPTADGHFLLGGSSMSNTGGFKSEDSRGGQDYWLVKIDEDGNKRWDKTYGGDGQERMTAIAPSSDGGFILGGSSVSSKSGEKSEDPKGLLDFWVVKIDAQGNKLWDRTFSNVKVKQVPSSLSRVNSPLIFLDILK